MQNKKFFETVNNWKEKENICQQFSEIIWPENQFSAKITHSKMMKWLANFWQILALNGFVYANFFEFDYFQELWLFFTLSQFDSIMNRCCRFLFGYFNILQWQAKKKQFNFFHQHKYALNSYSYKKRITFYTFMYANYWMPSL